MTVQGRHKEKQVHKKQKGKKTTAEVKKPRDLPKAKKHKPPVPVLPLQSGAMRRDTTGGQIRSTASSQGPSTSTSSEDESADNGDEHGDGEPGPAIQSVRSHDSGRTVLYPDLYVLTNVEHWTMTPEAHKHAAAAGSFCFVTTEN